MARTWLKTTLSRLVKESAIAAIQVCLTLYFLFVSLVGGLLLFGWSGLVLGPVILTVTSALLEICGNRLGKPQEGVQSTARAGLTSLTPAHPRGQAPTLSCTVWGLDPLPGPATARRARPRAFTTMRNPGCGFASPSKRCRWDARARPCLTAVLVCGNQDGSENGE